MIIEPWIDARRSFPMGKTQLLYACGKLAFYRWTVLDSQATEAQQWARMYQQPSPLPKELQ